MHYLCATEPFDKTPGPVGHRSLIIWSGLVFSPLCIRYTRTHLVGDKGLEPLREHMILSHARLPIPPIPHVSKAKPKSLARYPPKYQVLVHDFLFSVGAVMSHSFFMNTAFGDSTEVRTPISRLRVWFPGQLEDGTIKQLIYKS